MKSLKYIIIAVVAALFCSSCLESNMKDLEEYSGAEISSALAYYRYIDNSVTFPLSGAHAVKQVTLNVTSKVEGNNINVTVAAPAGFNGTISLSNIVIAVNISTAAVIAPAAGSPALGVPADWTSPHKYIVTAADGTTKEWTITVTLA